MKIALVLRDANDPLVPIEHQLGLNQVVSGCRVSAEDKDVNAIVAAKVKSFEDIGLKFSVYEGLGGVEDVKLDRPGADEQMDYAKRLIEALGRNGVNVLCYNWMPVVGWHRTKKAKPSRGGSVVTAFDVADEDPNERTYAGVITEETLWKTLDAFLREIIPVCEKWNVKMSLHPDDPPILTPLKGISRIITSARNYQRVFDIIDSAYNTMTFCQANIAAMGEDIPSTIRRFGNMGKITFVHFRDIRGDKNCFEETWHDDGMTDMYKSMKAYYEVGFDGVARPDHVPTMIGEANDHPGYAAMGNIFAVGYMVGLQEAVIKQIGL